MPVHIQSLLLRVVMILVLLHLSHSKEENSKEKIGVESYLFSQGHNANLYEHKRHRRAGGCCTVTTSSCNITTPYRTMDGSCNNLNNPCWGAAGINFIRLLPPKYENNIDSPRGFERAIPLPRPRTVSSEMVKTMNPPALISDNITLMVMQWGQFCDHDMTFTPDLGVPNCCNSTNTSCFNIDTTNDTFYKQFNVRCLPFVRSTPSKCPPTGNKREQINERTAFLDASMVYGSSVQEMNDLRVSNSFLLKFSKGENQNCAASDPSFTCGTFLPTRTNNMSNSVEFFAGDFRVEEQPGLTSIQTLFVRMHNDLSQEIRNQNSLCSNEIIFQETRKIIGALIQQITYGEFLPVVLGPTMMTKWGLNLGNRTSYNNSLNPSTPNVFSTSSFRFGHSLIKNTISSTLATLNLSRSFNNHNITLFEGTFPSQFMIGIANDNSEPMDHILVDGVHNRLFSTNINFGEDLYARNIQRGRDHGIPPYVEWVNRYNPGNVTSISSLTSLMPSQVVATLNKTYGGRLNDIDLFPAAIAENKLSDAILGPTFANINSERFRTLKNGDRFWFENTGVFTSVDKLNAISNTKLAAIICFYSNSNSMQPSVMKPVGTGNAAVSCSNLVSPSVINLITLWSNLCPSG